MSVAMRWRETGWELLHRSISGELEAKFEPPQEMIDDMRESLTSSNFEDVVNCVKISKIIVSKEPRWFEDLQNPLETSIEFCQGKGDVGEWCCELASDIIDEYMEEREEQETQVGGGSSGDVVYSFGGKSSSNAGQAFNFGNEQVGGGPRGRGKHMNKPAWMT